MAANSRAEAVTLTAPAPAPGDEMDFTPKGRGLYLQRPASNLLDSLLSATRTFNFNRDLYKCSLISSALETILVGWVLRVGPEGDSHQLPVKAKEKCKPLNLRLKYVKRKHYEALARFVITQVNKKTKMKPWNKGHYA